jgi:putative transposase
MSFIMQPWHLLVVILAIWINRHQQAVIDFQAAQIKVLMEKLCRKRILLNDDQRRCLAVQGKMLGRRALRELTTIFNPDTILRWHRHLVASKWDYSQSRKKKQGRPPVSEEIRHLVLRMVRGNPT